MYSSSRNHFIARSFVNLFDKLRNTKDDGVIGEAITRLYWTAGEDAHAPGRLQRLLTPRKVQDKYVQRQQDAQEFLQAILEVLQERPNRGNPLGNQCVILYLYFCRQCTRCSFVEPELTFRLKPFHLPADLLYSISNIFTGNECSLSKCCKGMFFFTEPLCEHLNSVGQMIVIKTPK